MTNKLYGYLTNTPQPENYGFDPMNGTTIDETWKYVLGTRLGLKGLGLFSEYAPFINDIWQGRNLLFHTPFDQMTNEEYTNYGKMGRDFYKNVLHKQKTDNKFINGEINFPNKRAMEPDYKYMEQYPFLRKNIKYAKQNTFIKPKPKTDEYGNKILRTDANGFNNLKVKWKGKDYAYQIKDNSNGSGNDFYNIKPYEFLYDYLTK